MALVLLFVVLPFVVAGVVVAYIWWRSSGGPAPLRTSDVLATGEPAEAEVLSVKAMTGPLDVRPMVKMGLRISLGGQPALELEVTQAMPRSRLRDLRPGDVVEVRVTADRAAAAVVLGPAATGHGAAGPGGHG